VVDAYLKAGLTEEDALMNARMARILRAEDWDFENNEVKLWTP
jgi:DNA polymerase-1